MGDNKEQEFLRDLLKVNSGNELATTTGMEPNEGVIVAVFPESVGDVFLGAEFNYGPGHKGYPIMGRLGPWGERLLDIVTDPPTPVKWWKVRDYAREKGLNMVPERWQGAVVDIPQDYFDKPHVLGIRLYNEGPWFWPKEQPIITNPETQIISNLLDVNIAAIPDTPNIDWELDLKEDE